MCQFLNSLFSVNQTSSSSLAVLLHELRKTEEIKKGRIEGTSASWFRKAIHS